MTPSDERRVDRSGAVPHGVTGITGATWLWLVAVGLGFWLAVAEGILWLV